MNLSKKRDKGIKCCVHICNIKTMFKTHVKFIIGFVIGMFLTTGVYAAIKYDSANVGYDNTTSGLTSTTTQDAIDELKIKTNNC